MIIDKNKVDMLQKEKYKLEAIEFDQDEWEMYHVLKTIHEKHRFQNMNILEIGAGKSCLIYSVFIEYKKYVQKLVSIDVVNKAEPPDKLFYEKVTAFSTMYNHGNKNIDSFEGDITESKIFNSVNSFLDERISVLIIEYLKSDEYMDEIFELYKSVFNKKTMIIYKYINKTDDSFSYFNKIKKRFSEVKIFDNGIGTGVICNTVEKDDDTNIDKT